MKVCVAMPLGKSLDLARFSVASLINNAGLEFKKEFDLIFITCKTSNEVFSWIKENNYACVDVPYIENGGFIKNLYNWWNTGHDESLKKAEYAINVGSDHAYYKDWLKNMILWARPNRIVNCKLIEPGCLPSLHTTMNLGRTTYNEFNQTLFHQLCQAIYKDELITDEVAYGHRLDASPYAIPKDVWERFGPMIDYIRPDGITGDTDLFDRMRLGGVEITKALNSISYHCGGLETQQGNSEKRYT